MPIYEYKCDACGKTEEKFVHKIRPSKWITCRCGMRMRRLYSAVSTNCVYRPRWSRSLGVNETQIEQAKKLWPDNVYNEKGDVLIMSRQDKLKKMRQRNMLAELE